MCGIAGFLADAVDARIVKNMSGAIAHRGPEDEGAFHLTTADKSGVLIHRRLRIIDLSPAGHQPMLTRDGALAIVFNGEIYNYRQLRAVLQEKGHEFRSNSDTEVILMAYAQWGADCMSRLHGMFAFALWDRSRNELLLARDRLGKKPLFYFCDGRRFAFGSEIKAVLPVLNGTPPVDYEAIDDYLTFLYIPYPKTIFAGIRQLAPGTRMRVKLNSGTFATEISPYWDPLAGQAGRNVSVAEGRDFLDHAFTDAVQSRMLSDVPLGVLLSGGLDSSSIAAVMAQSSSEPVRSFSIGFEQNKTYDEIPYANAVAERFGCDHKVLQAQASCAQFLAKVLWHFDQPFGNPTSILTYILSALTKQSVTVALAGDGGDELFAGYPRYAGAYLSGTCRALPHFLSHRFLPWVGRSISDASDGRHRFRRMREFLEDGGKPLIEMYLRWIGYFSPSDKADLYSSQMRSRIAGYDSGDFVRNHYRQAESLEPLNRLAYVDIKSFLCCNVLEYADRMSMAHALELRAPLTDHRLVEYSLQLPFAYKFRYAQSKWIFKRVMKSRLPDQILNRPKLGFNPPVGTWLKGELKQLPSVFLSVQRVLRRGLFDPSGVERVIGQYQRGERDHSLRIWALVILELWFSIYIDGRSVSSVQEEIDWAVSGKGNQAAAMLVSGL